MERENIVFSWEISKKGGRALLAALLTTLLAVPVHAAPTLVVVVRHAERATEPPEDPSLSIEGRARAIRLADRLADARVTAIVTTHYRRTQETAAPLGELLGLNPIIIPVRFADVSEHVEDVVAEVSKLDGVVLVVGHSNTVAPIVSKLSGANIKALCESSYSHLFLVSPASRAVIRSRYGAVDPPPGENCQ
jgi:broad specificity phosphatase PhoE